MPSPRLHRAARCGLALGMLATVQLLASGCGTPNSQACDKERYRYLTHPGDTFQYFRDMIRQDELKCAWRVLSDRLRNEVIGYSKFSFGVRSDEGKPHVARLMAAEYVDSFWMDSDGSKALMRLRSDGELIEVPMIEEDSEWHVDWNISRI